MNLSQVQGSLETRNVEQLRKLLENIPITPTAEPSKTKNLDEMKKWFDNEAKTSTGDVSATTTNSVADLVSTTT